MNGAKNRAAYLAEGENLRLRRPEDISTVNAFLPDYVGFVFAPGSRRRVNPETAARLKAELDPRILAVGVFVDAPVEQVVQLLDNGTIDVVQLHGHEDETYLASLRRLTDKPVIQAFRIESAEDVEVHFFPPRTCSAGPRCGRNGRSVRLVAALRDRTALPPRGRTDAGQCRGRHTAVITPTESTPVRVETGGVKDKDKIENSSNGPVPVPQRRNSRETGVYDGTKTRLLRRTRRAVHPRDFDERNPGARTGLCALQGRPGFPAELTDLLNDYAGRPSRLYLAEN